MSNAISVIVPAHNEAALIERCLRSLVEGGGDREVQIVVVCNGCSDDTAGVARRALPEAVVIETSTPSKHAALDLGDEAAEHFPRCYVDADVIVSPGALDRVAEALERGGALAAAPRPHFDLSRSGAGARLFLKLWQHAPYYTDDLVGSGFYALSEAGRQRFGAFPPVVADDYFVHSLFERGERVAVDGCTFTPLLPTTLRDVVNIHIRHYAAHRELAAWQAGAGEDLTLDAPAPSRWALPFLRRPQWWPSIATYVAVKLVSKVGGVVKHRFGSMSAWNRDQTGRDGLRARAEP